MAYPTIEAPYGLRPVNLIGGQVFAGSTRMIPIASGYDTSIFYGDVVKLVAAGTLEKDTGTTAATPVGVFLGCEYTDPNTGQLLHSQYFPANTAADDIRAYVADDPDLLFKVAHVSGTTVIDGVARTAVGSNVALVQNAGSTVTGNSAVAVTGVATTNTLPLRIVDVVEETVDSDGNGFAELIVKWNFGMHQYDRALGI